MPRSFFRLALAFVLLPALAALPSACRQKPEGSVTVVVIGGEPRLSDPVLGPLSPPDAVLLENVAQGLVRLDAGGNVVGGLAERWNVSDDGLSYIFRIASAEWSDGRKVTARQVVRALKRQISAGSNSPLKDALGAVEDIVAMTDRVIEIRLLAPRPSLLPLLAQPQFAILRGGYGTGPFRIDRTASPQAGLRLTREIVSADEEEVGRHQEVQLSGAPAEQAVRAFAAGKADLVLGGTFADLPYARAVKLPRNSLRFDPSSGLFGLVPVLAGGPLSQPGARRLLNAAIDRDALINALNVPGLAPRATVLEPGLDGVPAPPQPTWFSTPIADRRVSLLAEANRLFGTGERLQIRIFLPQAPGSDIVFNRIAADWGALGLTVERAKTPNGADFRLLDLVAPSTSPAWFVRQFRCGAVAVCDEAIDQLLDAARQSQVPAQRYALLAQAAGRIEDAQLFMPIAAPIRWSLVSPRIRGFSGNRYARHTLTDLEQKPGNGG